MEAGPSLGYSREHAVRSMLIVAFFLGTITLAPLIVAAIEGPVPAILFTRAAMIVVAGLILGVKAIPARNAVAMFCLAFLSIGAWTMTQYGFQGEGLAWLIAAPVFAALLLGKAAGLGVLLVVAAMLAAATWLAPLEGFAWARTPFLQESVYVPFLFLDAFLMLATGIITTAAERTTAASSAALAAMLEAERNLGTQLARTRSAEDARAAAEDAAHRQEALFLGLVEHSADILMLLDADGRVRMCGPAILSLAGYTPDEIVGRDFFSFILEEHAADQRAMFSSSLVAGLPTFSSMFSLVRKDGSELPIEASGSNYLHNPNIVGVIISLHDLTKQRTVEAKAEFYEHFDPLTSLPNRETFIREVERAVTIARNRNRVFGIMSLGLDRFKRINDLYGTETGDRVLKEMAAVIKGSFRNDDVVARYRGDKFFALFPDIRSQEHIKEIIAKARTAFASPLRLDLGETIQLSASIGVALYPNDGKERGGPDPQCRNGPLHGQGIGPRPLPPVRRTPERRDPGTPENRERPEPGHCRAADSCHTSSPRSTGTAYIVGAEALVRWKHPSGEIKSPGYFIDVAEKCGSIDSIGDLMLRMSCEMAASWYSAGPARRCPSPSTCRPTSSGRRT